MTPTYTVPSESRTLILTEAAPTITPWYLSGSVASANCLAAYRALRAYDFATSKINLVNPGTYNLSNGTAYPTWAYTSGWTFASASSQYLTVASALVTANPLTMICGFTAAQINATCALASICDTVGNSQLALLAFLSANIYASSDTANAITSTSYAASTHYVAAGVFTSTSSRAAFLNGAGKGTDATVITPASLDTTFIGCRSWGASNSLFHNGTITACAFYNAALSDAQVLAISNAILDL
jgi:hypothetical protein